MEKKIVKQIGDKSDEFVIYQQQQQPNTSSNSATGSGGQTGNQCPEVEMVSDVDCSISEND